MNVKSQATITYGYCLGGINIKSASVSNVVNTEVRTTDLLVKKIASAKYYKPNDYLTYTIIITNQGNYQTKNINVLEKLENQVYIDGSFDYTFMKDVNDIEVNATTNKEQLNIFIASLDPHAIVILSYRVKVTEGLSLDNEIKSQTAVESTDVARFNVDGEVVKQGYAKITCTKKALPDFAYLNTDLVYRMNLKNIGNTTATNVLITDQLPETFALDEFEAVILNDEVLDYEYHDNILQFTINEIGSCEELIIYIKGKIIK